MSHSSPPGTPFSTPLSSSAKEAEARIRNLFSAKRGRPPLLILVLAWTLKGMTDALGIGDFVRQAVSLNEGLMRFVPLLIFCIAIFIAFSSGTSWGTFAILVPIVVNMFSETDPTMMIVAVSAVLAGAVCGDHISPISDTTVMSSAGAQSNHLNHVSTQMQYAAVTACVCLVGYLIAAVTRTWWITLGVSLLLLLAVLTGMRRFCAKKAENGKK